MSLARKMADTSFVVDLRPLTPGHFLGGNARRVVACDVCGLGAVRLTDTLRKDGYHARYAHRLSITLSPRLDPIARYDERHIVREPHSSRPTPANDNEVT